MEQTIEVYFGKGEYAITSKNVDKLIATVDEFEKGNWKWAMVDCLGVQLKDGGVVKTKRHTDVIKALESSPIEKCRELSSRLVNLIIPETITKATRATSEERKALQDGARETLKGYGDFTEAEIEKMVKGL